MPVTVTNTNYGDASPARRHESKDAAPVAKHPAPEPVEPTPTILPTATKAASVVEQNKAAAVQAEKDAAAAQAKADATPSAQATGPIPSPFDVLGGGKATPETKQEAAANKAAAKEAAHGSAIDDDPEKDWVDDTSAAKK
jgi:hypothetical protein